jgi:hypothetical protein
MKIRDCARIRTIESILDDFNAANGTWERLCVFCKSDKYNAEEGIIHSDFCLVKQIRNMYQEDCSREKTI